MNTATYNAMTICKINNTPPLNTLMSFGNIAVSGNVKYINW